jgi:diaminopimelate epimerase
MNTRPFKKMHGLGNDFVIVDARGSPFQPSPAQAQRIADRHFGVGCDQLIVLEPPTDDDAQVFMRIYNADGSQAEACGNATRCVARLMFEESGRTTGVQTVMGILPVSRLPDGQYMVGMGPAFVAWQEVPLAEPTDTLHLPELVPGMGSPVAVSIGNPHCVFFVEDADALDFAGIGAQIEHHPLFPNRTNVQFVTPIGPHCIRQRVWERGVGVTGASGSGACAGAVASLRRGVVEGPVRVNLDGGELLIDWDQSANHITMTGGTTFAFDGLLSGEMLDG